MTYPDVGFINFKAGDFTLKPGSRFKAKAENGKDYGCDVAALNKMIAGVETSAPVAVNK
jgi:hypothetical protein